MMRAILTVIVISMFMVVSAKADPTRWRAEGWTTDFSRMQVTVGSIQDGGPPKDGIPPIDQPKLVPVDQVTDLSDLDPVISLTIDGDSRAYPLRVMTWHEIVNDKVGGQPVVVTYCPLCSAAIVFDASFDGQKQTFGTTGKLRNSDLLMYDRATESWWQQFSGAAIAGKHTGKRLKSVPSRLESWSDFRERYPDGKVLVPNEKNLKHYGRNPYANYDAAEQPFLYSGTMPKNISPMERVVVVRQSDREPIIVSMATVRKRGKIVLEDYTIHWKAGRTSALLSKKTSKDRDFGSVVVQTDEDKRDVAHDVTFAFVAHAFHPGVSIIK